MQAAAPGQAPRRSPLAGRMRALRLRARFNLLVALCVLPLLILTLSSDYLEYRTARRAVEAQALDQARGFADDVGRVLQAELASLQTLALSASLEGGRFEAFRDKAAAYLALRTAPAALRVGDAAGRALFATGPVMDPRPETVRRVFADQRPIVSGYTGAAVGGRPGFCLHVPVFEDGRAVLDLQLALDVKALEAVALAQPRQPGWGLLIADGGGRVLVHMPHGQPGPGEMLAQADLVALRQAPSGIAAGWRPDGTKLRLVFATVPLAGWPDTPWRVVLGIPERALLAPLYRTTGAAALIGLVLLAGGLGLAGVVARRIVLPIARLQQQAATTDGTGPVPPTGLPETDAVAAALHAAALARRDALARLQALAETLESRVAQEVAARQAAQAQAAQGERMQALGHLASGIAHDFNNVLQTISATAGVLAARPGDAAAVRRALRRLEHATQHGMAITGRLLGFARREDPPALAPIALAPVLADLHEMLRATLGGGVVVEETLAPDLPPVLADRAQLETVLVNLAVNARDAMPEGGRLSISARAAVDGLPPCLAPGRYVALEVADTGVGMTPEVLARVTEPFFTTKPAGRGTGLGLSLARGFAEQAGGALAIASTPGQGTTVTLWLRAAEG